MAPPSVCGVTLLHLHQSNICFSILYICHPLVSTLQYSCLKNDGCNPIHIYGNWKSVPLNFVGFRQCEQKSIGIFIVYIMVSQVVKTYNTSFAKSAFRFNVFIHGKLGEEMYVQQEDCVPLGRSVWCNPMCIF